jgi:uncharacterized protein YxeA
MVVVTAVIIIIIIIIIIRNFQIFYGILCSNVNDDFSCYVHTHETINRDVVVNYRHIHEGTFPGYV